MAATSHGAHRAVQEDSSAHGCWPHCQSLRRVADGESRVAVVATAFFVMLAGFQYMSAGGSTWTTDAANSRLFNAFIGFAIVILCKVLASLVGSALGAPAEAAGALHILV
jgi:hypothetical protein